MDIIKDIRVSCDVALELVNDMLTFDKLEEGKLTLEKSPLPVWKVIKTAIEPFFTQVNSR